jgi:hypothetical protein
LGSRKKPRCARAGAQGKPEERDKTSEIFSRRLRPIFLAVPEGLPTVLQDPVAFVIEDIKMTYETTPGAGGRAACRPGIPGDIGCFHAYSPLPQ